MQNSPLLFELLRNGRLVLSLDDAISLALENNLDIELQRYSPKLADTDVLRAEGGGLLRGLSLLVNQPPPGIGGPNGPLLTNLTAGSTPQPLVNTNFSDLALISQQQNNLSVTGQVPQSTGPAIPQFDPALTFTISRQHATTPQNSTILTGSNWLAQSSVDGMGGTSLGFSSGAQASLNLVSSSSTTDAARYTYNPLVSSSLGLAVSQPLLRGFGASVNRRFIKIARLNRTVAEYVFRQQVIDAVAGVVRLYIDLVSLIEDVKVKQESVRLAERLFEDNRVQVEQGTQAPIELTRAKAALAAARQALISAEGLVRQQELVLKTFLTRAGLTLPELASARIIPSDSFSVPAQEPVQPLAALLTQAVRNRPDLASAALQVETSEVSLKGSRNALLPQVDLIGTVANGGMSGSLNPLADSSNLASTGVSTGGYGSTLSQIFRRNYPTYGIGLQVTLPVRNRVAQADVVRDELQLRQTQVRRQQLEDQIRLEVADAEESVRQTRAAYDAAVEARRLQEESVSVEQQTFAVGLSTNLMLAQFQNYLAQARSTEVAAKGAYLKARVALERALGSVLDQYHIEIDDAYHGQPRRPVSSEPQP